MKSLPNFQAVQSFNYLQKFALFDKGRGKGLYEDLVAQRIFTLRMEKNHSYEFSNDEECDYKHDLDLLLISHYLHVSHPIRSGCGEREKKCPFKTHLPQCECRHRPIRDPFVGYRE